MNAQTFSISSQGQARWWQRSRFFDSPCSPVQRGIHRLVWPRRQVVNRHWPAVQLEEQRRVAGVMALHVHEARMEVCRPVEQGQERTIGPQSDCGNCQRPQAKQGKLVCADVVGIGQPRRPGNICTIISAWRIPPLATARTGNAIKKTSAEKRMPLSVIRTAKRCYSTAVRTRGCLHRSVARSNEGHFSASPLSVARIPSRYTTPYRETQETTQ